MYSITDLSYLSILEDTHVEVVNVCCECGESYGDTTIIPVTVFNRHIVKRDGHIKSHGYCPKCFNEKLEMLRLHPGK
jgi:hypothetical protein